MEFTRAEIKEQARAQLKGKVGILFVCMLVASIIPAIISGIATAITQSGNQVVGSLLSSAGSILITPPIALGLVMVFLNVTYGEDPKVSTIFEPFKTNYGKAVCLSFLVGIFVMLWCLLLVIPGIIMAYAYSQSFRILAENPDMAPMECIKESKRIMKGRKMDLFVLQLSFIGWILLVCVTFGIAAIYVYPYMQLAETNFYHKIKEGGDLEGDYNNAATNAVTDIIENAADKVEAVSENVVDKVTDTLNGDENN
ncbi:MAG: DUF975 family protein [Lachnospiraceae bacterium]|nr:DUF975 family protein [Lachnospiraceae bacterium]